MSEPCGMKVNVPGARVMSWPLAGACGSGGLPAARQRARSGAAGKAGASALVVSMVAADSGPTWISRVAVVNAVKECAVPGLETNALYSTSRNFVHGPAAVPGFLAAMMRLAM